MTCCVFTCCWNLLLPRRLRWIFGLKTCCQHGTISEQIRLPSLSEHVDVVTRAVWRRVVFSFFIHVEVLGHKKYPMSVKLQIIPHRSGNIPRASFDIGVNGEWVKCQFSVNYPFKTREHSIACLYRTNCTQFPGAGELTFFPRAALPPICLMKRLYP